MEKAAHKAGYVNIIGNPNVGKSTLMNAMVGEKLSIITSKAQTTRHRILGIVNDDDYQICFSDTPGIIQPAYQMQEKMMGFVKSAFEDADVLIYMIEIGEKALKDEKFFEKLQNTTIPLLILINKIDTSDQETVEEAAAYWQELFPKGLIFPVSALRNFNTDAVMGKIKELLPTSPPFFDKDALTDKPERFFVNEIVREKILLHYSKEIPYSVEIDTENFKEEEDIIRIRTLIYVERESQKNILIGPQGKAIKRVGIDARKDLQQFFGKQIHIELFIKVLKNWRNNTNQLKRFGYEG